ncbi:MAG: type II secretion system F family protein [Pirellulales bacterium]|nr:type II secretion system F family protein [Pirellulales bacterium]
MSKLRTAIKKTLKPASRIKSEDLTFLYRNLATLVQNGVSLPKALSTLAREKALLRYRGMLEGICHQVEIGESFSHALTQYQHAFDSMTISQIKVGERSGTMGEMLDKLATQHENTGQLKSRIYKKLAYPIVLMTLGIGIVIFMMLYVIPTFESTYSNAGIPLPYITRFMIGAAMLTKTYGWLVAIAALVPVIVIQRLRDNHRIAQRIDYWLLHLPIFGNWLRDIAVLQLMEVIGNLMESGFTLAEALEEASESIGNRAIRKGVKALESAVLRGERFSREIERHGDMFPPIVSQLVIVGERTGKLANATAHIRTHLRREIERKTSVMVGTIEPVLTISLAAAIAVIMLAIYLPMFDMINTADM